MKKKLKISIAAAAVGLFALVGGTAVYAEIIPGWDEPWDPPNYYSTTSISWADTLNPSFFYRDLGWQGGAVLDVDRLKQWVTTVQHCMDWLSNAENILELKVINSMPLSEDAFNKNQQELMEVRNITGDTYRLSQGNGIVGSGAFRKSNRYDEDTYKYEADTQALEIEKATAKIVDTSAEAIADNDDINRRLDELVEQAANAKGERELSQVMGYIRALEEAVWARRNALIVNLSNMNTVTQIVENDERLAIAKQNRRARLHIQDPYNRSQYQEKIVPKPEPIGFINFKE